MATFAELESAAPSIAAFFRERIEATGLSLVATTRSDGWPRVSPLGGCSVCDGRLYMGSMPDAVKAKDLQRDPRCCIITPLADKDDLAGEAKLFCRAREIDDAEEWERVRKPCSWSAAASTWATSGGSHRLHLSTSSGAAWQRVEGDDWRTTSLDRGRGPGASPRRPLGRAATSDQVCGDARIERLDTDVGQRSRVAWWSSNRRRRRGSRRRRSSPGRARPRWPAPPRAGGRGRRRRSGGRSRRRATGTTAISPASATAVASASPSGTTRLTKPMRSASSAPISRPVRIRSSARPRPTICGRR